MRVADRSERPEAPGREFAVVHEDDAIVCIDKPAGVAVHGGSGESFGVIEQMRRARPGEFLELVHRLDKETSGLLLVAKTRPALVKLQNDLRSRAPGAGDRQDLCGARRRRLAGVAQGDRRRPAQGHARRRQPPRPDRRRGRRARPALDQPGSGRAALRRLQPARRDAQDRPHAPDPGPSRRRGPSRSPAIRSTATSRSTARSRAASSSRRCASTGCSCTPGACASSIPRAASRSSSRRRCRRRARRCSRRCERRRPERLCSYVAARRRPPVPARQARSNAGCRRRSAPSSGARTATQHSQRNPHHEDQASRHRFRRRPRRRRHHRLLDDHHRGAAAATRSPSGTASTPTSTAPWRASMRRIRRRAS